MHKEEKTVSRSSSQDLKMIVRISYSNSNKWLFHYKSINWDSFSIQLNEYSSQKKSSEDGELKFQTHRNTLNWQQETLPSDHRNSDQLIIVRDKEISREEKQQQQNNKMKNKNKNLCEVMTNHANNIKQRTKTVSFLVFTSCRCKLFFVPRPLEVGPSSPSIFNLRSILFLSVKSSPSLNPILSIYSLQDLTTSKQVILSSGGKTKKKVFKSVKEQENKTELLASKDKVHFDLHNTSWSPSVLVPLPPVLSRYFCSSSSFPRRLWIITRR